MGDGRIKVRSVLVASGLWPRRRLRRLKGPVLGPQGPLPIDGTLVIGGSWVGLRVGDVNLRARQVLPPVILLHKARGCTTSRRSEAGAPTVFDAIAGFSAADDVQPVGRLDKDTSGVLLFAASGQLLHRLTHPKREVPRVYDALLRTALAPEAARRLCAGSVVLDDGHVPRPVTLETTGPSRVRVTLTEGKYHEVRRMFAAVDAPVLELHRVCYGGVTSDDLEEGAWRRLAEAEVAQLHGLVQLDLQADYLEVEAQYGEAAWDSH